MSGMVSMAQWLGDSPLPHTVLAADLGLRNDQLSRVAIVSASERVLENADGS